MASEPREIERSGPALQLTDFRMEKISVCFLGSLGSLRRFFFLSWHKTLVDHLLGADTRFFLGLGDATAASLPDFSVWNYVCHQAHWAGLE